MHYVQQEISIQSTIKQNYAENTKKKKNKKYEMTSKIKNKILINLIDQMLIPEPKNRIKIDAILAHPWFSSDKIISMDNSISSKH